jgi:hypothetical protein
MASTRPSNRRGMTKGQIRADRRQRSERRKARRRTIYFTVGGLLGAAFIVSLLVPGGLSGRNSQSQVVNTLNTAGPVEIQPDQGRDHITVGSRNDAYITSPATSGGHWPVTGPSEESPFGAPVRWGNYEIEITDEALVHNLEHGGIGLHYNCPDGCQKTIDSLVSMAPRGFSQFVISPYSNMDSKIAITAWRHVQYLDEFDEDAIRLFIDEYLARAPENVPGNLF